MFNFKKICMRITSCFLSKRLKEIRLVMAICVQHLLLSCLSFGRFPLQL
jgi:hypothetical protein